MSGYWSFHTHSRYSAKDALPAVPAIVARAAKLGYPALGLTDHGNPAGAVELYTECRKVGIKPLPGIEAYVAFDRSHRNVSAKGKPGRIVTHHACFLSTSEVGYRNLVRLNNTAVANFHYVPTLALSDLAEASARGELEGVVMTTGCWFGLLAKQLRDGDPAGTRNVLRALSEWFDGRLFVELQNHGLADEEHDDALHTRFLFDLAQSMGLPVLIGQDSHYTHVEHRRDHDYMKRLVSWSDDPDDAVFPGDGYHMVSEAWMQLHHEPDLFEVGMQGLAALEEMADVRIPELDHYSLKVPTIGERPPYEQLVERCEATFADFCERGVIKASAVKKSRARMEEELATIKATGFAGYLVFVAHVTDWMRAQNIGYNARGSAAGFMLCWLMGITPFDPLVWGLSPDRFLTATQIKPPDVDLDVEHDRRREVIDFLLRDFVVQAISTWGEMKVGKDAEGDDNGSLIQMWRTWARKKGRDADGRIPAADVYRMKQVAAHRPYRGYGVHAAGLVVAPDESAMVSVPNMWVASSKTLITAFDMESVEKLGLVKLDLLGLKTLTAMRTMQAESGVQIHDVPLNDKSVLSMFGRGETAGVFQLGEYTARRGVQQLKPRSIHDVIASMALFRPAPMKAGDTDAYIARRHKRAKVPTRHPLIEKHVEPTFGVLLYQEQALNIMKDLGLTVDEVERARKAIKASNDNVAAAKVTLEELVKRIHVLGEAKGLSLHDLAWLEQGLHSYADYGFNKAHATAYGVVAYASGWYKQHHKLAFWTGMLQAYTGAKKGKFDLEKHFVREARKDGIPILPPHVNVSTAGYTMDRRLKAVRRGLRSVKGIGVVAAAELERHAPYESLTDLATRVSNQRISGSKHLGEGHQPKSCGGMIAALYEAGALNGLAFSAGPTDELELDLSTTT